MSDDLFIEDDDIGSANDAAEAWKIIVVDDDPSVHQVTRFALQNLEVFGRPLKLLSAFSAEEGFDLIKSEPDAAMAFIDVVMETEHAGLDLIRRIRSELHNHTIRFVVRTGQPGVISEVEVTKEYDINQYTEKSLLTYSRLTATVYTAIRSYRDILALNSRTEELVKAVEQAKAAEKAKTEFLGRMSHEFRTPMNAILGYTQIVQMSGNLEPAQNEKLEKVLDSGNSLLTMLNDILDFSFLDLGLLELKPGKFSVNHLVETFNRQFSAPATKKQIELEVHLHENVPDEITADLQRLEQILHLFGDNAIKFTSAGGKVVLDINTENSAQSGDLLVLSVTDTGIGISDDQLKTLFYLFTQLDGSGTRHYGGIGLGLTLAKKLAELMGGEIAVESTPGVGSCFRFKLPVE